MSKRKPHSINKRREAGARYTLKKLHAAVIWVAGQNNGAVRLVSLKTGKLLHITPSIQSALADYPHDWTVYCAVFGRRQDGQEYMNGDLVAAPRCKQASIAWTLHEIHLGIIKGINPVHRVGVGWIACPWGEDITEEAAAELFDAYGAWELERLELTEEVA